MTAKVVYYTKSGNTQKIANAIGSAIGCAVTTTDTPLTAYVDVLFLGASVYKFGIDKAVQDFISSLNPQLVGCVVIFSTSAMSDSGYPKLVKLCANKNITVSDKHFYCRGEFMLANKNRPNADDVNAAARFAADVMAHTS